MHLHDVCNFCSVSISHVYILLVQQRHVLQKLCSVLCSNHELLNFYYSRKLCVYNLCVYNAAPANDGFCYCWVEVEGGRGSNEIGTYLLQWTSALPTTVTQISLYSDTCGRQNRNKNIAIMFRHAIEHSATLKCITHNFLESRHSHMECDSMHAAIEHEEKFVEVFTMLDWVSVYSSARRSHLYKVHDVTY